MANENLVTVPLQFELSHLMILRPSIRDDIAACKNHIAMYVEQKKYDSASGLVEKLREKEEVYARINRAIHAITGKYD